MRSMLLLFFSIVLVSAAKAQFEGDYPENFGTLKIGAGYTHDFPGLNGVTVSGEFSKKICNFLEGAFGVKRVQLSGYPRTAAINEYTKATTLDMLLYFLPLQSGPHTLRTGLGYSFSFYKIQRAYPVVNTDKTTSWQTQASQGRGRGMILAWEYQYALENMPLNLGFRIALYQAYDGITYAGPFVGWRL
ncbi:MAG: hypothetical protein QM731_16800 [Chitinophagaceae bacterium]